MTVVSQPRAALSTVIHSPIRLAILGALRQVELANFSDLREALELTPPELSRQLGILEKEGMVEIAKFRERRRTVTRVRLSDPGRERFEVYLNELRRIVGSQIT
ncbi:transcriptional regulator [Streptomyces sp. PR69]|uniref:transcriptional regulator n=1 Tax=Streptomyces sp. PR69 TaxID=2984950 RepID=UPI002264112D|nr:transcriptional regulator [Streptomyces sp. PR69]